MNRHPSEIILSRYADGDLGNGDKNLLESHLKNCKKCGETLACFIKIKNLAETLTPVEVPPSLLTGVKERIARDTKTSIKGIWRGAVLGVALSSAIALFAILPHAVRPNDQASKETISVKGELIGPPIGLAKATTFGEENLNPAESTYEIPNPLMENPFAASIVQTADYNSEPAKSTSEYILVPLDDKARQDLYEKYNIEINSKKGSTYPYLVNLAESLENEHIVKVKQDILKLPNSHP